MATIVPETLPIREDVRKANDTYLESCYVKHLKSHCLLSAYCSYFNAILTIKPYYLCIRKKRNGKYGLGFMLLIRSICIFGSGLQKTKPVFGPYIFHPSSLKVNFVLTIISKLDTCCLLKLMWLFSVPYKLIIIPFA